MGGQGQWHRVLTAAGTCRNNACLLANSAPRNLRGFVRSLMLDDGLDVLAEGDQEMDE